MAKNIKHKKITSKDDEGVKDDAKKIGGDEEETEKEGGALSDGVLDAFEETSPLDPLEESEVTLDDLIDEEDKDDMDYNPDEW